MLSAKQQCFVNEFSLDRNASRAARAAGYSAASAKVTASRLLTNANVRAAVTVREMEAERDLAVSRAEVLTALHDAFELAKQQSNPAAMIAACREIGRMCGYYLPERHSVETVAGAGEIFEAMSDQELLAIVDSEKCMGV